jgi:hypothetical protein
VVEPSKANLQAFKNQVEDTQENIVENIKLDQSASGENIEMNEMFSGDSISDPGVLGASSKPGEYLDLDMDKWSKQQPSEAEDEC